MLFTKSISLIEVQSFEHLPYSRNQQYGPYINLKDSIIRSLPTQGPVKISVVVPVFNVSLDYLKPCIDSVLNQSYTNWELCICDDASNRLDTKGYLKSLIGSNPQITVVFHEDNRNISIASNSAIAAASGEFICLLDHDDVLHPDALAHIAQAIENNKDTDIFYSDEDKLDQNGMRVEPYYKPTFSPTLLLANNYICHLLVIRKSLGDKISWFREGYEGAQDHDLILRLTLESTKIHHIPHVLYHWRKIEGSTALGHGEKSYAEEAGKKAIKQYLKKKSIKAKVKSGSWAGAYHISYKMRTQPKVSIVIPFKDQVALLKGCCKSIFEKTKYGNFEIVLVNNNSIEQSTLDFLKQYSSIGAVKVIDYPGEFNYSKINNKAISQVDGELVLLLNNDIQVITKGWLTRMVSTMMDQSVGAVGPQLLYDDRTSQHSGLILGIGGVAGHAFKGMPSSIHHYYLDGVPRDVSGCTAACLLVRRSIWKTVGGLNEVDLKVAFNDVDFCLKIRKEGHKNHIST